MIIEYCNGKSLSEVIDIHGRIPEEEALAIIKQVAEGLYVSALISRSFTSKGSFIGISALKIFSSTTIAIK